LRNRDRNEYRRFLIDAVTEAVAQGFKIAVVRRSRGVYDVSIEDVGSESEAMDGMIFYI
jgi:hypothetical protein